jgi:4-amino-4-deoxy-L-arabinose transferase-like glycosyltransferase
MNGETLHLAQKVASGNLAIGVSVTTASSPAWVSWLNSDTAAAAVFVLGAALSLVILCVNLQLMYHRATDRMERKRKELIIPAACKLPVQAAVGSSVHSFRRVLSQRDLRPRRRIRSTTQ